MKRIFDIYGISENHSIIPYNTNIYTLYNQLPENEEEYADIDLLQLLKGRETDPKKLELLDERYTDILMVFDLDPQAPDFLPEKIRRMANYFTESTNMGKLYLNYPMVESFYHMKRIPDDQYISYLVSMDTLKNKEYKQIVHDICRNGDYNKFVVNRDECSCVIKQNLEKARLLTRTEANIPDTPSILDHQLELIKGLNAVSVLCTCVFYIADYNLKLIN